MVFHRECFHLGNHGFILKTPSIFLEMIMNSQCGKQEHGFSHMFISL